MNQGSREPIDNTFIKTGVEELDAAAGGVPRGGITLLVGQRGSGKSDLGLVCEHGRVLVEEQHRPRHRAGGERTRETA